MRLPELLRLQAATDPGHVAFVSTVAGTELSLSEWDARSDAVAMALLNWGIGVGDTVLLAFRNEHWNPYVVAYAGVLKSGAIAVPVSPDVGSDGLAFISDDAGAKLVLHSRGSLPATPSDLPRLACETIWEPSSERGSMTPGRSSEIAEVLYTSGTTGAYRGVVCTHDNVSWIAAGAPAIDDLPKERFLHFSPIGTNAAQIVVHHAIKAAKMTCYASSRFEIDECCRLIENEHIEVLALIPAMALALLKSGGWESYDGSSVRRINVSGSAVPGFVLRQLRAIYPNASVTSIYGLTEAGTVSLALEYDGSREEALGRPRQGAGVEIWSDAGEPLPPNALGEIVLVTDAPARYYLHDAPPQTESGRVGTRIRTGDLGYVDEEAFVYLVDRIKDVVISGGMNISTVDVERVLSQYPAVSEAAVFAVPHPVLGEALGAAVVLSYPASEAEVRQHVRNVLGPSKVLYEMWVVESLPKTVSGKVLKRRLREQLQERQPPAEHVEPRDDMERSLRQVWASTFGIEGLGVTDNFFKLGGESILAVQLADQVGAAVQMQVPVDAIFNHPTVESLAAYLRAQP